MARRYSDRTDAGSELAAELAAYRDQPDVLVLGLPRGGVPVAARVAGALGSSLDVFLVRKLGAPGREELAMGAIASGGVMVLNDEVVAKLGISDAMLEAAAAKEGAELARRERAYRGDRPPLHLAGRTVILVDDGLATGATMKAAVAGVRLQEPRRIVVAVPVGAPDVCAELSRVADAVVCPLMPQRMVAVGFWYEDFAQTSDAEVSRLLGP
jgi:predicted phosphoribosyltransferase